MRKTAIEMLTDELKAVNGEICGWTCDHLIAPDGTHLGLQCLRAPGHRDRGDLMGDMHIGRLEDGSPVVLTSTCCETTEAATS